MTNQQPRSRCWRAWPDVDVYRAKLTELSLMDGDGAQKRSRFVQGYLANKKPPPRRTLQWAYAYGAGAGGTDAGVFIDELELAVIWEEGGSPAQHHAALRHRERATFTNWRQSSEAVPRRARM